MPPRLSLVVASTTKDKRGGIKGGSYHSKTDSWVATLIFKDRHYYPGRYDSVRVAAQARWWVEDDLVKPFI